MALKFLFAVIALTCMYYASEALYVPYNEEEGTLSGKMETQDHEHSFHHKHVDHQHDQPSQDVFWPHTIKVHGQPEKNSEEVQQDARSYSIWRQKSQPALRRQTSDEASDEDTESVRYRILKKVVPRKQVSVEDDVNTITKDIY